RILILKQLAVPGPIPLRSRLMERRQQCPHQPDILEALHDRRRYFPRRALLGLPFRGLLCVHSPTLYETRLHLKNFVPNTIGPNGTQGIRVPFPPPFGSGCSVTTLPQSFPPVRISPARKPLIGPRTDGGT